MPRRHRCLFLNIHIGIYDKGQFKYYVSTYGKGRGGVCHILIFITTNRMERDYYLNGP